MKRRKLLTWILILAMIVTAFPVNAKAAGTITVTVSVYGDSHHNADSDGNYHTYAAGNLQTWVGATVYSDLSEGITVWALLQRVFEENGILVQSVYNESYGSEYIQGITPPGGGQFLMEKENGIGSGWMYKLNGQDVATGISNKKLSNGDVLEFHYTDDYTKESFDDGEEEERALAVEELIDAIGTVTEGSGDAIAKARSAYDALSDTAKALVTNYEKLKAAEAAYAALIENREKAKAVEDLINAIGTVTEESGDAIAKARSAYDALTDEQKALVSNLKTLTDAEEAYADIIGSDEDQKKADEVTALIEKIGKVTAKSEEAIKAARAAYNALTATQKSMVKNSSVLSNSEKALEAVKKIDAIGTVTAKSGSKIEAARKAYDALSEEAKKLVSNVKTLTAAEKAYDQALADDAAKKIKQIGQVTAADEDHIKAARTAYDALTKAQKKLVKNYADLTDAEAVLPVEKRITAIGTVTLKSEDAIQAARKAYDRLTDAQKKRATGLKTLEAAEKQLEKLKKEEEGQGETSEDGFTGKGTKSDPYLIRNLSDLKKLQKAVNTKGKSFSGKTFKMTADITIPADWTPIGNLKKGTSAPADGKNIQPFSGTFDGGGHLLSVASGGKCLFGFVRGATIRNLNLYGQKIASDGLVANYTVDYGESGSYTGTASRTATFENITIKKGTKTLYSGIIGATDYSVGKYSQSSSQNNLYFSNCTVEAGVTIGYDKNKSGIGSLAGHFNGTMTGCSSAAAVYGKDNVGGLIGFKDASMGDCEIDSCSFTGSVTASGSYAGGIIGSGYNDETAPNARCVCVESCTVSGSVSGSSGVGGILGGEAGIWQAWENGIAYVRNNTFTGKVSGSENVGAILGYYRSLNRYTVIENNFYANGCGASKGIGKVLYVDSSIYADNSAKPAGWKNGVYRFDSSEDDIRRIKSDLNAGSAYYNIARANHNRTDDPLGKDAKKLTDTLVPEKVYVTKLTTSGNYKTEYTVGDPISLAGLKITAHYSDGTTKDVSPDKIKVTGFSSKEAGTGTITLSYEGCSVLLPYTVKPKDDTSGGKTTVTVTVLGDSVHDSDSDGHVHGLAMGGLSTWVAASTIEAKTSETVWDVLQRVFSANGITPVTSGNSNVYISALKRGGVTLGEFTNGAKSGWMYTVNGSHPLQGVSQRYIKNGDKIVFHYSDDYTKEEGSEGYNDGGSSQDDKKDEKTDRETGSGTSDRTTRETVAPEKAAAEVRSAKTVYEETGDHLEKLGDPVQGSVGGRWMALGLARSGRSVADSYYESVEAYVAENIDENERLHFAKSTDNSGEIIALTALGKDVTDVAGHDLLMGLTDLPYVKKQGINGPIWALIAFDSGKYEIPENPDAQEQVTRENLIKTLLDAELAEGGWALSGEKADSDITGMALTALAPYYESNADVKKAVDRALERLSQMQNKDGSFSAFGGDGGLVPTSESTSQILVALSALGIDAATDPRFVKNGNTVLSALCEYHVKGSGFKHLMDGEVDGMATEQAYYALTAYFRMKDGKTALYDMTDVPGIGNGESAEAAEIKKEEEKTEELVPAKESSQEEAAEEISEEEPEEEEEVVLASEALADTAPERNPVPWLILIAAVAAGLILLVVFVHKRRQEQENSES